MPARRARPGADLDKLRLCATLVARKVDLNRSRGIVEPPPDWQLEPMGKSSVA